VIGATDSHAAEATQRPISYPDVLATLYHRLGIDLNTATLPDLNGRPRYLCDSRAPIAELV
jgi:hypothetical protein